MCQARYELNFAIHHSLFLDIRLSNIVLSARTTNNLFTPLTPPPQKKGFLSSNWK